MRKTTKTMIALAMFVILVNKQSLAQLSGLVTINPSTAASASNFTSFTSFATLLNSGGVNGPLTVSVSTAVYNEQVNFTQAPGISSTNTITIEGNGATIAFSSTVATLRHTLMLSGADYMTFNNLTVSGTHSVNALACHLWAGADYNTFNSCIFNAPLTGTGTFLVPFSISGTSVSATGTGNSGNFNVVSTCTTNGGYYGVTFYGATTAPFNTDNSVVNSRILDFYSTGVYNGYCRNSIIRKNSVERPIRTAVTSVEGIYLTTGTLRALVENNQVSRLYHAATASTTYAYGIYNTADGTSGNENVIRNNVISDIRSNGIIYGVYLNASPFTFVYHNTISIDDASATAGNTRGVFLAGASINSSVRNNVVTVTRAGTGIKYCLYYAAAALPGIISENNVVYINSPAGTNNLGWSVNDYATLSAWQTDLGLDLFSISVDPLYTNPAAMDYVPTSTVVNNLGAPLGVPGDFNAVQRSLLFPDPGAFETYTTQCTGIPPSNSFVTPTVNFCPGSTLDLFLLSSSVYTNTGYTIQWNSSTVSSVGPFTLAATNATLNHYVTPPINVTTYYNAVITCTVTGLTFTTATQGLTISALTTSVVPYYESFESLARNELPNCNWSASNMGGTTLTYTSSGANNRVPRTGSNFASFYNAPSGTSYFYTNGIYLTAGITYSAALWYITESINYDNWTDLSILVGPNQTPSGQTSIVSTNGTVTPQLYTLLSDTFRVATSGLYYVSVKATSGTGVSPYLSWDDLSITLPCEYNATNLDLSAATDSICEGQSVNLFATGADTYIWSTGQTSTVVSVAPLYPSTYTVVGENTLSGCSNTLTQLIYVNPSPQVIAYVTTPSGCAGQSVQINAAGANTYFWNHGVNTASTIVSPFVSTDYIVAGTNSFGCSDTALVKVTVAPAPVINIVSSATLLCKGDEIFLSASGALSYQWMLSSTSLQLGNAITASPSSSGIYTVSGKALNGCEGMATISFAVYDCTGLSSNSIALNASKIYPSPGTGVYTLSLKQTAKKLEVMDMQGKVIYSGEDISDTGTIDLSSFSNGIYFAKIQYESSSEVMKIIKN